MEKYLEKKFQTFFLCKQPIVENYVDIISCVSRKLSTKLREEIETGDIELELIAKKCAFSAVLDPLKIKIPQML